MPFQKLNHALLHSLLDSGYSVLTSPTLLQDENPTWTPKKVDDIDDYISNMDVVPLEEPRFLVIEEALSYPEDSLEGVVWVG